MNTLLYWVALCIVRFLQALPLRLLARLGRMGGALAWKFDGRHRKVILSNLEAAFSPEKSPAEIEGIGRENLKRIGENYACALKTSRMTFAEAEKICEIQGLEKVPLTVPNGPRNFIVAIGHFGNFELNANIGRGMPNLVPATTYRGLKQPALDKLLKDLRQRSGCKFFERRSESRALRLALNEGRVLLGLLSDQHAGNNGVWGPFLGRMCSTTAAPAVFTLRYDAVLFTAICYRIALARWRIEVGDQIPSHVNGSPRSVEEITGDINRAFEAAIRRDPANWFWVHKRWKAPPARLSPGKDLQPNAAG